MSREPVLLGIDLGTSSLKIVAMKRTGELSTLVSVPITSYVQGRRHEQDPEEWWRALRSACTIVSSQDFDLSRVAAIGLTGHMHGAVLVDAAGQPLRRCITWADTRAHQEADELQRDHGQSYRAITMNDVEAVFTAPGLLWLTRRETETLRGTAWIVSPKDFLRARLTDRWATDRTDAAGTLLLDVRTDQWSEELLDTVGIGFGQMPPVSHPSESVGVITRSASEFVGLPEGAPVVAGAGDIACATLGAGLIAPREVYINVGTAAQVLSIHDGLSAPSRYWLADVSGNTSIHSGTVFGAGLAHSAVARGIAAAGLGSPSARYRALDTKAREIEFGAEGLMFLPNLGGNAESGTFGDGGAFVGTEPTPMHRYRAVLDGVALAIRSLVSPGFGRIRVGGGIRRSDLWLEILSSVLETPIGIVDYDSSPVGAAMLAGIGIGWFSSASEAIASVARSEIVIEPVPLPELDEITQRFAELAGGSDHGL